MAKISNSLETNICIKINHISFLFYECSDLEFICGHLGRYFLFLGPSHVRVVQTFVQLGATWTIKREIEVGLLNERITNWANRFTQSEVVPGAFIISHQKLNCVYFFCKTYII